MSNTMTPETISIEKQDYTLREMTEQDVPGLQTFAKALPEVDLLYLNRDITKEPVVKAWWRSAQAGEMQTLVLEKDGVIEATSALLVDPLSWAKHVGEIRVLVSKTLRRQGVGRLLIERTFQLALERGLSKIIAQMTIDQKGAIAVFEELGFSGEALLKDHVQDSDGELHDLLLLSCDVKLAAAQLSMTA